MHQQVSFFCVDPPSFEHGLKRIGSGKASSDEVVAVPLPLDLVGNPLTQCGGIEFYQEIRLSGHK